MTSGLCPARQKREFWSPIFITGRSRLLALRRRDFPWVNDFIGLWHRYRLQDLFGSSGWTPSRSTLDYLTELVHETTQELPKLMLSQIKKGRCLGLDDTQVKLIMPKELPDKAEGIDDPQIKRLIEKMIEAKKEKKDSLDAKMWGYSSFDSSAP